MISLREQLRQRDTEQLNQIAQFWGVCAEGPEGRPDAEALAARMAALTPVRTAFDQLDPAEKEVLRAMNSAAHKGWVVTTDIRRLSGLPESRVTDLIRSLEAKAIAFTEERDLPADNPYWGATWAGRRLLTRPTPVLALPVEIASLLLDVIEEFNGSWHADAPSPLNRLEVLPLDMLLAMARHYEVSPADGSAQSAVKMAALLQSVVKEHAAIWRVISALPPVLRAVLNTVEAAGGRLPMAEVREQFAPTYEELHTLVRVLTERGLAFDRFEHRARVLRIPHRVMETLAQHTLPALPQALLQPTEPPAAEERWHEDLYWDLLLLVRHIRLEEITRTVTTHAVPKRIATRLTAQMRRIPADTQPEEWIEQMLLYLGALRVIQEAEHIRLTQPEPEWLRQGTFPQAQALLQHWREGRIGILRHHSEIIGLWMDQTHLAAGRELLLDLLRGCRPGQWYSVDSLLRRAAGMRPFFMRDRDRLIHQHGHRGLKHMLATWFEREGAMLLLQLTGLPFELGMVALDRAISPKIPHPEGAFCLTEWGAALLGLQSPPDPPDAAQALVVQPNFAVIALEFVPGVLDTLGQFATPVAYDRVATYRIEHRWINLAVANGWTNERILEFLSAHTRTPLPQNVAQSIRDWASSVRRARFVRALVIESDDPAVLEDLAASKLLRGRVRGIARGAVLLVAPDTDLKQITRGLRPEGFVLESEEE